MMESTLEGGKAENYPNMAQVSNCDLKKEHFVIMV